MVPRQHSAPYMLRVITLQVTVLQACYSVENPPDTSKSLLPSLTRPAAATGGASTAAADLTTSVLLDLCRVTGFWGKGGSIVTCLPMDRYPTVMVPKIAALATLLLLRDRRFKVGMSDVWNQHATCYDHTMSLCMLVDHP